MDFGAPDLHHRLAIGLLVVAGSHHPHLALEPVLGAGEGEGAAPLTGTGLGGELPDSLDRVVERLGHRRVGLVRAGRAHALVLVVDAGRGIEEPLEPAGPEEGTRAPEAIDVEHLSGDVDMTVRGDLLTDQRHREEGGQIVGAHRLAGTGVQGWWRGFGQVRYDVVPLGRHLALVEKNLRDVHGSLLSGPPRTGRQVVRDRSGSTARIAHRLGVNHPGLSSR